MDLLRRLHRRFISRKIKSRIKPIIEDEDDSSSSSSSSPWDRLPDLAVDKIFEKLCVADRVRMQSVCKSWKSKLRCRDLPHAPEAPWLIMPEEDDFSSEIRLKSLTENGRIYRFMLPRLAWRKRSRGGEGYWCCCGSSDGWLLIAVGRDVRDVKMILWNPLSGEIKNLPCLSTLWFFNRLLIEHGDLTMSAMVRCMRVCCSGGTMVVAIVLAQPFVTVEGGGNWEQLALCTPHDQVWKTVGGEKPYLFYQDLCFHKGNLYALCLGDDDDTVSEIIKYDVSFPCCNKNCDVMLLLISDEVFMPLLNLDEEEEEEVGYLRPAGVKVWERHSLSHYLVECSITGELLFVTAVKDLCSYKATNNQHGNFCCTQTSRFAFHRLSVTENSSLSEGTVGEQGVFVGQMGSVSLKVGVYRDRVSFATRHAEFWLDQSRDEEGDDHVIDEVEQGVDTERLFHVLEQGVYDVQQGRIETKRRTNVRCYSGSVIGWFTPKL